MTNLCEKTPQLVAALPQKNRSILGADTTSHLWKPRKIRHKQTSREKVSAVYSTVGIDMLVDAKEIPVCTQLSMHGPLHSLAGRYAREK